MSADSTLTNTERQPLLSVEQPSYHDDPTQSPAADGGDEESAHASEAPKTRSWSTIGFQGVIVLLSFIVIGLFIKGFIEADDVEVCLSCQEAFSPEDSLAVPFHVIVRPGRGALERARWWTQWCCR